MTHTVEIFNLKLGCCSKLNSSTEKFSVRIYSKFEHDDLLGTIRANKVRRLIADQIRTIKERGLRLESFSRGKFDGAA